MVLFPLSGCSLEYTPLHSTLHLCPPSSPLAAVVLLSGTSTIHMPSQQRWDTSNQSLCISQHSLLKVIGKAINDASVCGRSTNEEVVEGMEGGIEGAATKMRPDDDVRSETVDIELGAVSLTSKPVEVKSEMTYNVRSEIINIVLDAVV